MYINVYLYVHILTLGTCLYIVKRAEANIHLNYEIKL